MSEPRPPTEEHCPSYANEAVFPQPHLFRLMPEQKPEILLPAQWGLTKREYFAGMAMHGFAAQADHDTAIDPTEVAQYAVKWADALLKELAK